MRDYEFTFVIQPEITDEGIQAVCQRFEDVLAKGGAEKLYYEDWGRRRLAYEVRRFQKGHYLILHFLSDGKVVSELERVARMDDAVLRFLTVLVDDDVEDVEKRKAEGASLEQERVKRAAEKAARDAEEAAAREAEAAAQAEADAKAAAQAEADAKAAAAEGAEAAEAPAGDSGEGSGEAAAQTADASDDASGDDTPASERSA